MIQYVLECIAFQLVFLVIYDFFLKRETFFQWNRFYLLSTFLLSLLLPFVQIEAFKTTVEQPYIEYGEALWGVDNAVTLNPQETSGFDISWQMVLYGLGALVSTLLLVHKLRQLYLLRAKGDKISFKEFTQILVLNSNIAFSFFKSIFIGDKVSKTDYTNIIAHELVHIKQGHSWDLLFFELMRIVGWFNPLVYVYQNRISELHEFIADAKVAKRDRNEQYQLLLSQVFQTQNISFINHFFKSSLIKKRIVMLQKTQSKKVWQLKYLLLVPIILGMLFYTSCVGENSSLTNQVMVVDDINNLSSNQDKKLFDKLEELSLTGEYWEFVLKDENSSIEYKKANNGSYLDLDNGKTINATMTIISNALSERINELKEEVESKDSLTQLDKGQLAQMIYELYPDGVEGITGKKGAIMFKANDNELSQMEKYNKLVAERSRLLKSADESNPIIVSLDQQINALKRGLEAKKVENRVIHQDSVLVPFAVVEEVPVFPGCENETDKRECFQKMMQKHIGKNFRYPEEAQEKGVQGRVSIMFTISEDGSIQNVKLRGPDKLLEDEAARIISLLPEMTAGKQKGKAVNVPYSIPITFKLRDKDEVFALASTKADKPKQNNLNFNSKYDADPVYYVDGVKKSKLEIGMIPPSDIESTHVYKKEMAIILYGEEATNGVIVITLKKKE
ncbi:M56 family metallopeptidase [Zobellia roscoffensis]|uniref:M56 family metallopeptidase n=1 Tax=Zobellia roscoffensis TaxID=2779508 RepID=UPI001D039518|nr:M56 family metallopeptidase [Zobellia roscoffensis]